MSADTTKFEGHASHAGRAFVIAAVGLLVAVAIYGWTQHWFRSTPDRSAKIAQETGATSCFRSTYYIENRLDGSKEVIYDCTIRGASKCVTYEGGIAHDATDTVRLLWADTFGSKPDCAG